MRPTTRPRLSGNHLEPTGMGVAYPNPLPTPTITPKQTYKYDSELVKLDKANPRPTRIEPVGAQTRGPLTSCRRPATTNEMAKATIAMVKTHEVWARVHPNSRSSGMTKTLQA